MTYDPPSSITNTTPYVTRTYRAKPLISWCFLSVIIYPLAVYLRQQAGANGPITTGMITLGIPIILLIMAMGLVVLRFPTDNIPAGRLSLFWLFLFAGLLSFPEIDPSGMYLTAYPLRLDFINDIGFVAMIILNASLGPIFLYAALREWLGLINKSRQTQKNQVVGQQ
ncbi:MAG: hypothetical protein Q4A82_07940 [Corynebacterium sp.]|nr:hypothetical protein [Corynebacterium sp.]